MTDKIRGRVNDSILLRFGSKRSRFGLRRVPLESGYFEAYNQANFHLIDLKKTIIHQITRNSIRLRDGTEHELDILVYATGFNAITGAFANIDWTGNNGVPLMGNSDPKKGDGEEAVWVDYRPRTNLGLIVPKSPNMFMILGPHQPLGNAPRSTEHAFQVIVEFSTTGGSKWLYISRAKRRSSQCLD